MKKKYVLKLSGWLFILAFSSINLKAGIFDTLQPVQIASDFLFTEGPCWHPDGYLVFSDIDGNTIYKWDETSGIDTFSYPSGKSNGIVCTKSDEFFICRHSNRDVAKMKAQGIIESYVSQYNSKKFNSPNDLELSYMGSVYFTDPDYGVDVNDRELSYEGLFCIPFDKSEAVLLDSTLVKPNGLTFVNDWRTLYVCESSTNTIYSYYLRDEYIIQDISKDKKVFLKLSGSGEIDGITSDLFGNIYIAFGDGGIKIFDKDANEVGTISLPEKVRNLCFGGKYKNILFVTAGNSLYKLEVRYFGDFIASGLLGVPTDKSVIFNALSDKEITAYIAYGNASDNLLQTTAIQIYPADVPIEITLDGLNADSKYYYTVYYKKEGETSFYTATSGSFHTKRSAGSAFSFAVEADPHLDEGSNYLTFRNMLNNALNLEPDFLIDLGDNFMVEKYPLVNRYYIEQRSLFYRNFWDEVCHSMPLFIVQGNHDTELRWLSDNSYDDPFNQATEIRKMYYPTPEPGDFYSGSELEESFVGKRENYYAWNWGDALFVVIDPYGYTEERTSDPWCFTLGKTQYDWFKKVLTESTAKYKFVFAHQLLGGDNLGRGGVEKAGYFENGGLNADETYGFDEMRPGWGKPLHQIMIENGVQIYFHGHDHFYAKQEKDGLIYQEVPQPSFPGYTVVNDASAFGYTSGIILPNSGHLNVTLLGDSARVDYVSAYHVDDAKNAMINGTIRQTYYVKANTSATENKVTKSDDILKAYQSGNNLYVESGINAQAKIRIYSLNGQILKTLNKELLMGKNVFELPNNLSYGIYLATIDVMDIILKVRLIKE